MTHIAPDDQQKLLSMYNDLTEGRPVKDREGNETPLRDHSLRVSHIVLLHDLGLIKPNAAIAQIILGGTKAMTDLIGPHLP